MLEYRIIVSNDHALIELGKENWILCCISDNKMYLRKEVKRSIREKRAERTEQYQKFYDLYPKKSGITSQKVINKIAEIVEKGEFDALISGVFKYNKKINVEKITPKFVLNPETFLNQRRWEDDFDIMDNRLPVAEKWMLPYIQNLDEETIKNVLTKKKQWEKQQNKDITPGVLENIIAYFTNPQ